MNALHPDPGTEIVFQWRKWDGALHWRHECVWLGSDSWGDWVGQPAGWHSARPGLSFVAAVPNVTLVPPTGDFALTVNRDHPKGIRVYIDIAWDVHAGADDGTPDPLLFTGIDMDLDVVRIEGERGTWIDDEDEWDEHRARYGYPAAVQQRLVTLATDLERRVRAQVAPFDDATADAWLDRLEELGLPGRA